MTGDEAHQTPQTDLQLTPAQTPDNVHK